MTPFFKKTIVGILEWEAEMILKKYDPKVIAITGSVGKTGTKDAVYGVISQFYYARKSEKSFNSEIGLPLTIIGGKNGWNSPLAWIKTFLKGLGLIIFPHSYPEWLVLETGVGKPGDMERNVKWLKTDIAIFTYFGERPVHVEFFKSIEHVVEEKSALLKTLKPTGAVMLNYDDPKVLKIKEKAKRRAITYGFDPEATLSASHCEVRYEGKEHSYPAGIIFRVNYSGHSVPVSLNGVFGKSYVYSALAALSVARELDLNMIKASQALANYDVQPGRLRLIHGIKGTFIIDDTYNSSPVASELALKTLVEVGKPASRIAVLGDMLELGKYSEEAHKKIGEIAKDCCDILVTVGKRSHWTMDGALLAGMDQSKVFHFDTANEAGRHVERLAKEGDIILVKGSQGMRMERAVEALMAHPEQKEILLARQEKEWLMKK
jgi:UDP-N-acetylmuramoyl-tripeptide--D-alanyl-D-alanine ligase